MSISSSPTQILSLQVAIVVVTLRVASAASVKNSGDQLQAQYGERATDETIDYAQLGDVRDIDVALDLSGGDTPSRVLPRPADRTPKSSPAMPTRG